MGDTERDALQVGTVGCEGRLFAGRPDFDVLAADKVIQVDDFPAET